MMREAWPEAWCLHVLARPISQHRKKSRRWPGRSTNAHPKCGPTSWPTTRTWIGGTCSHRSRLPVLVCVGRQSKVFPWQGSAYVGEHIAGAKTVFFEHSGHMPFYEEPEKFNQAVREFVQSLP